MLAFDANFTTVQFSIADAVDTFQSLSKTVFPVQIKAGINTLKLADDVGIFRYSVLVGYVLQNEIPKLMTYM